MFGVFAEYGFEILSQGVGTSATIDDVILRTAIFVFCAIWVLAFESPFFWITPWFSECFSSCFGAWQFERSAVPHACIPLQPPHLSLVQTAAILQTDGDWREWPTILQSEHAVGGKSVLLPMWYHARDHRESEFHQ